MKSHWWIAGCLLGLASPANAQAPKAVPAVEWTDPAGDDTSGEPGARDLVQLKLASDGANLVVTATLAAEDRAEMAGYAVVVFLDTDQKAETGGVAEFAGPGFEYEVRLAVCHSTDGKSLSVCAGSIPNTKIVSRHARAVVEKFIGKAGERMRSYDTLDTVVSGFGDAENPLSGKILTIAVPYATLGLKSGQQVRAVARESDQFDAKGLFPEVRLRLQ